MHATGPTFFPEMVDANGVATIVGPAPSPTALLFLAVGDVLKTTIQAHNFCGGVPVQPISVAFVLPGGIGTLRAKPLPTNPGSIIPSCSQGVPGSISMSPGGRRNRPDRRSRGSLRTKPGPPLGGACELVVELRRTGA